MNPLLHTLPELISLYKVEHHSNLSEVDANRLEKFSELMNSAPQSFYRDFFEPGHFTGSPWIVSPNRDQALLIFHRKLGRWLQPGGHADGDTYLARVAEREGEEETGVKNLQLLSATPVDFDIHSIPALKEEPAHLHYDVAFAFGAPTLDIIWNEEETSAIRWTPFEEILSGDFEDRIKSLATRTARYR